jgi:magnesium transporter
MEKILNYIEEKNYHAIKDYLTEIDIVDISDIFEELPEIEVVKLFRLLHKNKAAEVFAYLSPEKQQIIVEAITDTEISKIMNELFLDDAVDFIEEMPANVVTRVLKNVSTKTRNLINHFLQYPEDSAGSIMTIEYVELKESLSVKEAFDYIRKTGEDKETIYTCYVIGNDRKLVGVVEVKSLLLANPTDLIKDIMKKVVKFAYTTDDQEKLVTDFRRYGLLAMPVVDKEERLVGIVTIDDAVDILEEENTEDFQKMAALAPSDEPYLKTGTFNLAKNRIVWLLVLMLSATVTGFIISGFENAIILVPALVAFIPMLMDTGGNAGAQVSTLVIRGMALHEIETKNFFLVLWKELKVSIVVGFVLALVNFIRIWVMYDMSLALVVSITLYFTVIIAKTFGSILPIIAKIVKLDPALMASPIITTIVDASALIVYFLVAKIFLRI